MSVTAAASTAPAARLGIAASRRIGGAVVRNRAKRRIREVFRLVEWQPAVDVVVTPRRELIDAPFDHVRDELVSLVAQALRHPRRPAAAVASASRRGPHRGV
jgi:ribonuclease P protein component